MAEIEKMNDIELVIERKNLQQLLDSNDDIPRILIQTRLDAIIDEMKSRVKN